MASLNTLRTKFGIVLSIIIALALLAFILSLKAEMGFSGNDPKVGVIDGEKINYSEYYNLYEQIKAQSGAQESDEQQAAALAATTWQVLIAEHVLTPGFEKAGVRVSEQERQAMLTGKQPSNTFYQAFADPRTGAYNVAYVSRFLSEAESNPQAMASWKHLNEQARLERATEKYMALVRGGAYVNSLEVAQGLTAANDKFAGKWAGKHYSAVPDSLVKVTNGDIKAYYKSHKNAFKKYPTRTFSYVVFEVEPTDDDLLALEQTVREVGAEFAAAANPKSFVRANRNGRVAENYVSAARLSDGEAEALMAGRTYGPVLKNNEWTMARVLDTKMAPDSLGLRHIVLPYTEEALADSLLRVIRGGADFAELALRYSVAEQTAANGGDVGMVPFSSLSGEFASALAGAKQGDVVKVSMGDAVQLLQVYRAGRPVKHVQVASITYPVEASSATVRDVHNQALSFTLNAKGSVDKFNDAASTAALTPRVATMAQGERTVRGLEDSRDVAQRIVAKFPQIDKLWLLTGDGQMFAEQQLRGAQIPFYNVDVELGIANLQHLEPESDLVVPQMGACDLAMIYSGRAMGQAIPAGTVVFLKNVERDEIIPGEEYVIISRKIVTLRIVRTAESGKRLRLVAGDKENYDDIMLNVNDIMAVYKVKGKLIINT